MRGTWQTTDSGGGGLALIVVIVAALAIGSGAASAAVSALEVIAVVIGCAVGLAVIGGGTWLICRARSERPRAIYSARPIPRAGPAVAPELSSEHKPAIEPPREIHLHLNVSPDQLAAIMRQYTEGE